MLYEIRWTRQAEKDYERIKDVGLAPKVAEIMRTIRTNPFEPSQGFKKLKGRKDTYSRQITKKHRFTYTVLPNTPNTIDAASGKRYDGLVKVLSMWTHYESLHDL